MLAIRPPPLLFPDDMIALMCLGSVLLAYSLWVLVSLVDQEVHPGTGVPAAELPPRCDDCGYLLTGLNPTSGHCPECGKPIRESLADSPRGPNAW